MLGISEKVFTVLLVFILWCVIGFVVGIRWANITVLPDAYPIEITCIYEKEECINVWIHKDDVFMRSSND